MLNIINEKNDIQLVFLGDMHIGHKQCDMKKLNSVIDFVKENKNARIILMGDSVDMGLRDSVGGGSFDNDATPQEQIDIILDLLEPYKDKIYGIHSGNHEWRLSDRTSIDFDKMIGRQLGVKWLGPNAFHKVKIGDNNFIIYTTHGSSGGTKPHTKMKAVMDLGGFIDADIYAYGHVHDLGWFQDEKMRVDLRSATVKNTTRHFILTGGFLKYGGYVAKKNLKPVKLGSPVLHLSKDKDKELRVSFI